MIVGGCCHAYVRADVLRTDRRWLRTLERDSAQTTALRPSVRACRDLVAHRGTEATPRRPRLAPTLARSA